MNHQSSTFRRRAAQSLTGALALALIGSAAAAPAHADSVGDSTGSSSTGSPSTGSTGTTGSGWSRDLPFQQTETDAASKAAITKYYAAHQKQLGTPVSAVQHGRKDWRGGNVDLWYASWQSFTGGRVVTSSTGGTHLVQPGFDKIYQAEAKKYPGNGVDEVGGVPEDEAHLVNGVYVQNFVTEERDDLEVTHADPADNVRYVMEWGKALGGVKLFTISGHKNMAYEALGGTEGKLGAPTANETPTGKGSLQTFQKGVLTEAEGVFTHTIPLGPLFDAWKAQGAGAGAWGFPTQEATVLPDGTTEQYFQHQLVRVSPQGKVTASDYTRTYTDQFLDDASEDQGAQAAGFGPVTWYGMGLQPHNGQGYTIGSYEGGTMTWVNGHGYVAVSDEVAGAYNEFDAAHQDRLGDPVSFTYDSRLGLTTHFEHGSLRYDEKSKKVVETR